MGMRRNRKIHQMADERWEFRAWAGTLSAFSHVAHPDDDAVTTEERRDTYILTGDPASTIKIRGGELFEVKRMLREKGGCQLWEMANSVPFPVDDDVLHAWLPAHVHASDPQSLISSAASCACIREVGKQRHLFAVSDADVELASITIDERRFATVCIETKSFRTCRRLVEEFQLQAFENKAYGSFLREVSQQ